MANKRNYLIHDDVRRDPSLKPFFDSCVDSILNESIRVSKTKAEKGYPSYPCFKSEGREILIDAVLEYYLGELAKNGFNFDKAKCFSELMRKLCGWKWDVDRTLYSWIERVICEPFFYKENKDWTGGEWILKPGEPSYKLSDDYLNFACFIAVNFAKYGDQSRTKDIFTFVTALGSDLPAKLKKHGSGNFPKDILNYKDNVLSCVANDVFATIKITLKEESEESYKTILNFICRLLELDFPRSYSIDFRSPVKNYIPIKGLPKKGVNQLFANAICYKSLHNQIEKYARLAMREWEWYNNLEDEYCAMPGTFAVFALGMCDEKYNNLICDYLKICDGEHQDIHGKFVLAYIEKYGFTEETLKIYDLCEVNIQHLPPKLVSLYKKYNNILK